VGNIERELLAWPQVTHNKIDCDMAIPAQNPGRAKERYPEQSILGELRDPSWGGYVDDPSKNDVADENRYEHQQDPGGHSKQLTNKVDQFSHDLTSGMLSARKR